MAYISVLLFQPPPACVKDNLHIDEGMRGPHSHTIVFLWQHHTGMEI